MQNAWQDRRRSTGATRLINFNETAFIVASAAVAATAQCNSVANVATWFNQPNAISLAINLLP